MSLQLTQRRIILDHLLKYGWITSWDAITEYRITRISEYIRQLRFEGKEIKSVWRKNNNKRYVEYILHIPNKND